MDSPPSAKRSAPADAEASAATRSRPEHARAPEGPEGPEGPDESRACADALARRGVVVLRTKLCKKRRRDEILKRIDREISRDWPEFVPGAFGEEPFTDDDTNIVGGSFGAFANPSSFHGHAVRLLRLIAYLAVAACRPFDLQDGYRVSQVIDRHAKRRKGEVFPGEAWHRDEATNLCPGDIVYGGWINLGDTDQVFSCVPGSHVGVASGGGGFAKFSDAEKEALSANRTAVAVPPGCLLIFNELVAHEVVGKKMPASMLRLFTGWYVSKSDEPHDSRPGDLIFGTKGGPGKNEARLRARISAQAAMPIKSGQAPAFVPPLYWTNCPGKVEPLTTKLRPVALKGRTRSDTAKAMPGETILFPFNPDIGGKYAWTTLPSLQRMRDADPEVELWPPYSDLDMAILLPQGYEDADRLAAEIKASLSL